MATVGFDIGMSVAQLEARKNDLKRQLKQLDAGLAEANELVEGLRQDHRDIEQGIYELLHSITPVQTESSWDAWVAATQDTLERLRSELLSPQSIEAKAFALAQRTRDRGYGPYRIAYVASIDPSISLDQAQAIIARADASPPTP